ncbi:hypothetical protein A1O1_06778 [Capronia coronata CBS 617.96]|uniref:Amidase domain-containing protein n=1 Tax=Capronia coronata CBS 617.96 TaxID=1182541 RepID=W9YLL0_9EURO|nr:uncharacterized protein A1O1_06778 [Capronia coronata CBS 617.96]EXJ83159.1 hypothetical protein A1O1_06778 [Capronia coronata CBS 617.96]
MAAENPDWHAIAARHQNSIRSKIPPEWRLPEGLLKSDPPMDLARQSGILDNWELMITECKAGDILGGLRTRQFKAVDVTRAFCKRAAIAQQTTNCVAEILFEEALAQAAALDEYMAIHGRPRGLLHGLPISVKEHIHMRGTRATCALIAWADQVCTKDALIVRVLRAQGAVFHVKTTNPQTLMAVETDSNLFGITFNPHNRRLTCGGSTGGEGALIAMGGSVLGIGTDIGGSIRVPSAFCGVYGFKPSVARLPHGGLSGLHDGMQNIVGVVGPMARCVEDIELFCSAALACRPWDHEPSMIEMPWKTEDQVQILIPSRWRIGVVWHDGVVQPHPPVTRALKVAVTALQARGHTMVDWDTGLHRHLIDAADEAYFLDGGKEYREILAEGQEPPVPILKWLLDTKAGRASTVEETWKLNAKIDRLRTLYAEQWNATQIDAIICPVSASVASVHNESRYWGYTSVWNALDFPAVVVPAGRVEESDTWANFPPASASPLTPIDDSYRRLFPDGQGASRYRNAPVAIQIVGRRLQEERILKIASALERCVSMSPPPVEAPAGTEQPKVTDLLSSRL